MSVFSLAFIGVGWFFSCLFVIYIFSPLCIYILRKISKSVLSDFILLLMNIILAFAVYLLFTKIENIFNGQPSSPLPAITINTLAYCSPVRRIFYVLSGMNIAMLYSRNIKAARTPSKKTATVLEISICIIALIYYVIRHTLPAQALQNITDMILCAMFIFIFSFDMGICSEILKKDVFQKLGAMTMYIFILHTTIATYVIKLTDAFWDQNVISAIVQTIAILIATFTISILFYKSKTKHQHQ